MNQFIKIFKDNQISEYLVQLSSINNIDLKFQTMKQKHIPKAILVAYFHKISKVWKPNQINPIHWLYITNNKRDY